MKESSEAMYLTLPLPSGWSRQTFGDLISIIATTNKKIKSKEYNARGNFPVVDQGQEFISGYSDNKANVINEDSPVILFGDHTRNVKYLDFPFVPGADGVKAFIPVNKNCPRFLYFLTLYLSQIFPSKGYARHFHHIEKSNVAIPSRGVQKEIAEKIDSLFRKIDDANTLMNQSLSAIRGKLVPQDSNDEPASKLLDNIQKKKLLNERKKGKPLPPISDDDIPFEIPVGWVWIRLGEVIKLYSGQHIEAIDYNSTKKGTPYLTGPSDFAERHPVITKWTTKPKVIAPPNSILVTVKGSGVGKINTLESTPICISRQLMAVESIELNRNYVELFLNQSFTKLADNAQGLIPGLSREDIENLVFPLPPLNEQARISNNVLRYTELSKKIFTEIQNNLINANILKQSILKKAFAGEL